MVLAFANFPKWRQWTKAMAAAPVKLPKEQIVGNTEKWLLDSCAPALAKVIYFQQGRLKDGEMSMFDKFVDEVGRRLDELSKNRQTVH
jgi:hypothetical protein